eukprot:scaffold89278_cov33-Cyclotella_meneghiniana.AAC.2
MNSNAQSTPSEGGGGVSVTLDDDPLVDVLWPHVKPIINGCAENMKLLLNRLGVKEDEISPFLRRFEEPSDLLKVFEEFIAKTSSPDDDNMTTTLTMRCALCINEEGVDESSGGINSASQLDRIKEFVDVTLGKGDGIDAHLEGDDDDTQEHNDERTSVSTPQEDVSGEYECCDSELAQGWDSIVESDIENLAFNCRDGMRCLHATNKARGSVNSDRKKNSLLGRWLTYKNKLSTENEAMSSDTVIERNVHLKVEMKEKERWAGPSV